MTKQDLTFLQRLRRIFRTRTVLVAMDNNHWSVAMPPEAILLGSAQRGPILFLSFDVSDCMKKSLEFVYTPPPAVEEPQPEVVEPVVLFDRTKS